MVTDMNTLIDALYVEIGRCQRMANHDAKMGNDAHVEHLRSKIQAYRNVLKTIDADTLEGAPRDDMGAGIDLG